MKLSISNGLEHHEQTDPGEKVKTIFEIAKEPVIQYINSPKCLLGLVKSQILRKIGDVWYPDSNNEWKDAIFFSTSMKQLQERLTIMLYAFDPRLKNNVIQGEPRFDEIALGYANNANGDNTQLKEFRKKYKKPLKKLLQVELDKGLDHPSDKMITANFTDQEQEQIRKDGVRGALPNSRERILNINEGKMSELCEMVLGYHIGLASQKTTSLTQQVRGATLSFIELDSDAGYYLAGKTKDQIVYMNNYFIEDGVKSTYTSDSIQERKDYLREVAIHELFHIAGLGHDDDSISTYRYTRNREENKERKEVFISLKKLELIQQYTSSRESKDNEEYIAKLAEIREYANYLFNREEYDTRMKGLWEFFPDRYHIAPALVISEYLKDIKKKYEDGSLSNDLKYKYEAHRLFLECIEFDAELIKKHWNTMVNNTGDKSKKDKFDIDRMA